jgi:hypothetical protein
MCLPMVKVLFNSLYIYVLATMLVNLDLLIPNKHHAMQKNHLQIYSVSMSLTSFLARKYLLGVVEVLLLILKHNKVKINGFDQRVRPLTNHIRYLKINGLE